jgi:hypothetical protein
MRISCVLSDATRLPWPRLGRLDALVSLQEILSDARWLEHPHVRLCLEVGASACHAANPLTELVVWRERAAEVLRSGQAKATFEASLEAHGAHRGALEQVRRQAEARQTIQVPLTAEPEPGSLAGFFKAVRAALSTGTGNALGVTWRQAERILAIHVPGDAGVDDTRIRELAASIQTVDAGVASVAPWVIRFDGQIGQIAL